jgi:hypothetical protein
MGNKTLSYTANFKLQVVHYTNKHSKRLAGHTFDVNKQFVGEWYTRRKATECPKSKGAFHGKQSAFPQIEDELYAHVMDSR